MADTQSFTQQAWASTADIRAAIDEHPFLTSLRDGDLDRAVFVEYLAQDSHYLVGYARVLSLCAAGAGRADDVAFWASAARDAIEVERTLHVAWTTGGTSGPAARNPTCTAYLNFLAATAALDPYPVLAAAVTPCFWIYQDVGQRLLSGLSSTTHPYADWIATYGDPAFAAATERVKAIVDAAAEQGSADVGSKMMAAFRSAARYEWMFWDAAWRRETWPAFGSGSAPRR